MIKKASEEQKRAEEEDKEKFKDDALKNKKNRSIKMFIRLILSLNFLIKMMTRKRVFFNNLLKLKPQISQKIYNHQKTKNNNKSINLKKKFNFSKQFLGQRQVATSRIRRTRFDFRKRVGISQSLKAERVAFRSHSEQTNNEPLEEKHKEDVQEQYYHLFLRMKAVIFPKPDQEAIQKRTELLKLQMQDNKQVYQEVYQQLEQIIDLPNDKIENQQVVDQVKVEVQDYTDFDQLE